MRTLTRTNVHLPDEVRRVLCIHCLVAYEHQAHYNRRHGAGLNGLDDEPSYQLLSRPEVRVPVGQRKLFVVSLR